MNEHDRENVKFLMSLDPDGVSKWYAANTFDDIEYAKEILALYSEELKLKANFLVDPDIQTLQEAASALRKYMK